MNYKKILPSLNFRLKLLSKLDFIPDKLMISFQYWLKTGRKLNLNNPKRYSEKVQWYKLYYRDPLMVKCSDKYKVKEYVKSKGLKDIVVPTYGIYDYVEDIDFEELPNKFVIKSTSGGGGHNVIICDDSSAFDQNLYKPIMNSWLENKTSKSPGREWVYDESETKIIIEKYIDTKNEEELIDYKFYCFNGEPLFIHLTIDRDSKDGKKVGFFDTEFNPLPVKRTDIKPIRRDIKQPKNFEKMIEIARILSSDFPHVRVDLYNNDGEILFGELTFFGGSGYTIFEPDEFDYRIGEKFSLPQKM